MASRHPSNDRINIWLQRLGLFHNPFESGEAGTESGSLPQYFVDRPYLHEILGDPARPQTAFLLARRGEGKTATREMAAYECLEAGLKDRVLAAIYDDFAYLLSQVDGDVSRLSSRHHAAAVARVILAAIAGLADETKHLNPITFDQLDEFSRSFLGGFVRAFADPETRLRLGEKLHAPEHAIDWNDFSPAEMLQALARIVTRLGRTLPTGEQKNFQAVYVLVDRVDESSLGSEAAVPILSALCRDASVLEGPPLAFKFFLPSDVGEAIRPLVRFDRLGFYLITWDRASLAHVVEERLSFFSNRNKTDLGDLCTTPVRKKALDRLIDASGGSPRVLLQLCSRLVKYHVLHSQETLIDASDLYGAISEYRQMREMEQQAQAAPIELDDEAQPERGLQILSGGRVYVDGQMIDPPLSKKERELLETLYRRRPETVPAEELIRAVWPESSWKTNEVNLRKLVDRLRRHLEPGGDKNASRFIKTVRGQGYRLILG